LQSVVHVRPRRTLAFDCLAHCGLRDGLAGWGQFCIDTQIAAALPIGEQIRSVHERRLSAT